MPEQVGIMVPSGVMRMHQPRQGERAAPDPVRQRTVQMLPSLSGVEPKAYSW